MDKKKRVYGILLDALFIAAVVNLVVMLGVAGPISGVVRYIFFDGIYTLAISCLIIILISFSALSWR